MPPQKKLLTIAIPTFNRNQILLKNVEIILQNTSNWFGVIILDNCSDEPVVDTLSDFKKKCPETDLTIIRNSVNIGANANILRCIENVNSEYIWIIGDDDFINPDILGTIYDKIRSGKPLWINLYEDISGWQPARDQSYCLNNLAEFLAHLKSINELVFISTNIYKVDCIKKGVSDGYHYQSTMAPHLISMLSGIEKYKYGGTYLICIEKPFQSLSNNKDPNTSWPLYRAFIGIFSISKVPLDPSIKPSILGLIRGARESWLSDLELIRAFLNFSNQFGIRSAFYQSSEILSMIVYIDRMYSFVAIPMYICSVLLGGHLGLIKKVRSYMKSIRAAGKLSKFR
jgi:glycosyltransferase involved in cell wall biosynthesis